MSQLTAKTDRLDLGTLLRGEADAIAAWIESRALGRMRPQMLTVIVGAGLFGAAIGYWRDPLQALYAAIKLPVIVFLTATGNALLNGMFASLFGLALTLRQSFAAVLSSFALASVILGGFSPLVWFLVWNLPPLQLEAATTPLVHGVMMVALAAMIAFAGVTANLRLMQFLRKIGGSGPVAWRILFAWLAVNLLLGSQLSWILRPFIGAPGLSIQFMRADAFHGSFFETLFSSARGFFPHAF